MAVVDKYVDTQLEAGKLGVAGFSTGVQPISFIARIEVAADDDDGSVYRFLKGIPSTMMIRELSIHNEAVTGGTDYDLGIYKTSKGAAVDADRLMDGQSMATARARTSGWNVGLVSINIEDSQMTIAEFGAETDADSSYDLALTANTVGTAAGTIIVQGTLVGK